MILLTGATGRIGGAAAKCLAEAGVPFRACLRDASRFALAQNDGVDCVIGDLEDAAAVAEALRDVECALLVTANGERQADIERQFADLSVDAGVRRIVKVSSMEAAADATAAFPRLHYQSEQYIRSLPIDWSFVRPNFFMQNLLLFAAGIAKADTLALPFGDARTGLLDAADVGAFCAALLLGDEHAGMSYEVTGPELLDFHDVAERLSAATGRRIRYVDQDPDAFREFLGRFVGSAWHLDGVCELFAEIRGGSLERITPTLGEVLQRSPVSLDDFLGRHRAAFSPSD